MTVAYGCGVVNWVGHVDWPPFAWDTSGVNELENAAQAYAAAKKTLDAARDVLQTEIVKAARSGTRQSEIVRTTGFTRETVRRICRAAGVESE
jgi:hypothetical protein